MPGNKPVALIVGAGDFIGAAIARRFAAEGFVVCIGRRNEDKLAPLVVEIEAAGGAAHAFRLDARDEDCVKQVFADIERDIGPLEVVICNVGGNVRFPVRETTSRVFRKVWEMACFAGFLCGREAADYMVPRKKGAIFFTGATASMRGNTGYAAFASAKEGVWVSGLPAEVTLIVVGQEYVKDGQLVDAVSVTDFNRKIAASESGDDQS